MPSFDIVSTVDLQEVDNAVNNVLKELATRFDFRNVTTELNLNRKDKTLTVATGDDMKYKAIREMLIGHCVRRKVDPKSLEFGEPEAAAKGTVRAVITIKEGLDKPTAQKITKLIKDLKLKVQTQIQDEQVRVTGKKIDDLQGVIRALNAEEFELPLQFVNMKS